MTGFYFNDSFYIILAGLRSDLSRARVMNALCELVFSGECDITALNPKELNAFNYMKLKIANASAKMGEKFDFRVVNTVEPVSEIFESASVETFENCTAGALKNVSVGASGVDGFTSEEGNTRCGESEAIVVEDENINGGKIGGSESLVELGTGGLLNLNICKEKECVNEGKNQKTNIFHLKKNVGDDFKNIEKNNTNIDNLSNNSIIVDVKCDKNCKTNKIYKTNIDEMSANEDNNRSEIYNESKIKNESEADNGSVGVYNSKISYESTERCRVAENENLINFCQNPEKRGFLFDPKITKTGRNGQKLTKMGKNGQKRTKIVKLVYKDNINNPYKNKKQKNIIQKSKEKEMYKEKEREKISINKSDLNVCEEQDRDKDFLDSYNIDMVGEGQFFDKDNGFSQNADNLFDAKNKIGETKNKSVSKKSEKEDTKNAECSNNTIFEDEHSECEDEDSDVELTYEEAKAFFGIEGDNFVNEKVLKYKNKKPKENPHKNLPNIKTSSKQKSEVEEKTKGQESVNLDELTIEEVKEFIEKAMLSVDAENFYYYYKSKSWYVGKNRLTDWKAKCLEWHYRAKDEAKKIAKMQENSYNYSYGRYRERDTYIPSTQRSYEEIGPAVWTDLDSVEI